MRCGEPPSARTAERSPPPAATGPPACGTPPTARRGGGSGTIGPVNVAWFSPDGRFLLTASGDRQRPHPGTSQAAKSGSDLRTTRRFWGHRSARTAVPSSPPASTGRRGCGTWPAARNCSDFRTARRCWGRRSAPTAGPSSPPAATRPPACGRWISPRRRRRWTRTVCAPGCWCIPARTSRTRARFAPVRGRTGTGTAGARRPRRRLANGPDRGRMASRLRGRGRGRRRLVRRALASRPAAGRRPGRRRAAPPARRGGGPPRCRNAAFVKAKTVWHASAVIPRLQASALET